MLKHDLVSMLLLALVVSEVKTAYSSKDSLIGLVVALEIGQVDACLSMI